MADSGPIFTAYVRNPEITQFLIWRPHRTLRDIESYIRSCLETPPHRARTYVMQGRKDSVIRGCLDLRQADRHRLEFGYVLARPWWGQGLMTEALTAIVQAPYHVRDEPENSLRVRCRGAGRDGHRRMRRRGQEAGAGARSGDQAWSRNRRPPRPGGSATACAAAVDRDPQRHEGFRGGMQTARPWHGPLHYTGQVQRAP